MIVVPPTAEEKKRWERRSLHNMGLLPAKVLDVTYSDSP